MKDSIKSNNISIIYNIYNFINYLLLIYNYPLLYNYIYYSYYYK